MLWLRGCIGKWERLAFLRAPFGSQKTAKLGPGGLSFCSLLTWLRGGGQTGMLEPPLPGVVLEVESERSSSSDGAVCGGGWKRGVGSVGCLSACVDVIGWWDRASSRQGKARTAAGRSSFCCGGSSRSSQHQAPPCQREQHGFASGGAVDRPRRRRAEQPHAPVLFDSV